MKIYLVKRTDEVNYDEYDSMVVVAESEEDARTTHPEGDNQWDDKCSSWILIDNVDDDLTVTNIGIADSSMKRGVVLSSFNAS